MEAWVEFQKKATEEVLVVVLVIVGYIEKQRVFDYKVVFGSCRFPVVARPNRGHVDQWSVLYLAGILSKLSERDAQWSNPEFHPILTCKDM